MARPSIYKENKEKILKQAFRFALLGLTDEEMAEHWDVVRDTVIEWRKKFPEFSDTIKSGKEEADGKVAKSLYKRANGYDYIERTYESRVIGKDEDGNIERAMIETKRIHKHMPPDTGAAFGWLNNRQPANWKQRRIIEISEEGINIKAIAAAIRESNTSEQ